MSRSPTVKISDAANQSFHIWENKGRQPVFDDDYFRYKARVLYFIYISKFFMKLL